MPLNELAVHRPIAGAYHKRNVDSWLRLASAYRRATDECDTSTPGHWDSGSLALALSLRRCSAVTYTSSVTHRFTNMLLSPFPFGSRSVVHLEVICSKLRSTLLTIPFVRDTAHRLRSFGSYCPTDGLTPICQCRNRLGCLRAIRPNQC